MMMVVENLNNDQKGHFVYLGGGFKYFLFLPLPGEMIQFD